MSTLFRRGRSSRLRKDISVLTLGTSIVLGLALSSATFAHLTLLQVRSFRRPKVRCKASAPKAFQNF
jgi:hypothetical protein